MNKKIFLSILILILCFFISIFLGTQKVLLQEILNPQSFSHTIIFNIRLPRALLAGIAGALLASSGAAFQMYFRNSLAEPGILGITSGATLGAVIAQILGISAIFFGTISPINIFAFGGALASGLIIVFISKKQSFSVGAATVLLCGTALGTFYSSISSILMMTKSHELNGIYSWILGSFNGRGWTEIKFIILPSLVSAVILMFSANKLDLLAGGEITAKSLGLNAEKLRTLVLTAAGLGVSAAVCAGGTINFVGLIAPHIVRRFFGTRGKSLISISAVFGAILVLLSDTFARTIISPAELPTGVITSLLGAPFFFSLLFIKKEKGGFSC